MKLTVNESKCTGCQICESFCSFRQVKAIHLRKANLKVERQELAGIFRPLVCKHCAKPACAGACPEGALEKKENGIVELWAEKCTGCGKCISACPFKVLFADDDSGHPLKCDLCQGNPECAKVCPHGAITFA
jgi:Fe-S-cluster-containing dehydrogenase component